MKFILYNDLRNNLILCMFYEVLGCVIALVGVSALVAVQCSAVQCSAEMH